MIRRLPLVACFPLLLAAQSTQGLITGRMLDSLSGRPVAGQVRWTEAANGATGAVATDPGGIYYVPQLSPGTYQVRAEADRYQAQEVHELVLPVAARLQVDFRLRPLDDVWEQGAYRSVMMPGSRVVLTFFGPDVDASRAATIEDRRVRREALEASISEVVDPALIQNLPLAGRDVYTLLALLPGVASDGATGRGLGLSANGQRPSSSNFFLDGLEFNNYLVTGPAAPVAPDAVQEYRVSTNNFTAQYGGSSGFVANAVSRSGGTHWHGVGYGYFQNEAFNANEFQRNRTGRQRTPDKWLQTGFQLGGPAPHIKRLYLSSALERFRNRTEGATASYRLPTAAALAAAPAGSIARRLLTDYPSPGLAAGGPALVAAMDLAPASATDRTTALERLDYTSKDGRHRLIARAALARLGRPEFIWSPFRGLSQPLHNDIANVAVSHLASLGPHLFNEAKVSLGVDDLHWNRTHSEIPLLSTFDGVDLPSSPGAYSYKNATRAWQLIDNLVWQRGRHMLAAGGGWIERNLSGYLTPARDGELYFAGVETFVRDTPALYRAASVFSASPAVKTPAFDRRYRVRDAAGFVQDTFRLSSRVSLNGGLRFESFGSPRNVGGNKDALIVPGSGETPALRLAAAKRVAPGAAAQVLFRSLQSNWEPRLGMSVDLSGGGRTLFRAAWGMFRDRIFDNLWQTLSLNDIGYPQFQYAAGTPLQYLSPAGTLASQFRLVGMAPPRVTLFDVEMPAGRASSYFAGVRQQLAGNLELEVNAAGSNGSKLIVTDKVNRTFGVPQAQPNPSLPFDMRFRAPLGTSNYRALTASMRYRTQAGQLYAHYTWSHSIDVQSEPIESDLLDFRGTQSGAAPARPVGFASQLNPALDRGDSDFDQRQSLVFYSTWKLPGLRDWTFSQIAAFRTGFPYSVFGGLGRVNIVDPAGVSLREETPGGQYTINRAALADPPFGSLGNSGRNAFRAPGFYSLDASLAREFAVPGWKERVRLGLRLEAYNLLNHANLGTPGNFFLPGNPLFGLSAYGRVGFASAFPATAPLSETARRLQLAVRLTF